VVDAIGYGLNRLLRGALPLVLGTVGGLELFAPDVLHSVTMGQDWASALFTGGCGYFGFSLAQGGANAEKGK
jgi:hypothetical protein